MDEQFTKAMKDKKIDPKKALIELENNMKICDKLIKTRALRRREK